MVLGDSRQVLLEQHSITIRWVERGVCRIDMVKDGVDGEAHAMKWIRYLMQRVLHVTAAMHLALYEIP